MRDGDNRSPLPASADRTSPVVDDAADHRPHPGDSRRRPRGLPVVERAIIERMARVALVLWIAWAVVVWNVIFDQTIVLAGRDYIQAALAAGVGPFANMDDWMRPAVTRGAWLATVAGGAIPGNGGCLSRLAR